MPQIRSFKLFSDGYILRPSSREAVYVSWYAMGRKRRGKKSNGSGRIPEVAKGIVRLPYLPDEIIKSILSRLPVKSLLRFKCVNKHWNSIISAPKFTLSDDRITRTKAVFMTRYSRFFVFQSSHRVDLIQETCKNMQQKDDYDYGDDDDDDDDDYDYGDDDDDDDEHGRNFIGGSCNGLLLIVRRPSFFLWNPSTGYFKKVLELERLVHDYRIICGLCYDSSTDDYKVVIALSHLSSYYGELVLLASLKEKVWKELSFPYMIREIYQGPVCNGFLHWKASDVGFGRFLAPQKIIAFDPKIDEFRELPLPEPKNREGNLILGLGVLDGCLCMAHWDNESDHEGNVQILAMKEYGIKESWTILFEISSLDVHPFYTMLRPLLLLENGEVLMVMYGYAIVYNPRTRTLKIRTSFEIHDGSVEVFVESLVSPNGFEWDEHQHGRLGSEIIWHSRNDT